MKTTKKEGYKVVTAATGKWLTNGEVCTDAIYASEDADVSNWREVTEAEKNAIEAEQAKKAEEEAERANAENTNSDEE